MKKLFVGNLSWNATEEDLKTHFQSAGEVEDVKIVFDHYTGKSKGFGFVAMKEAEGAQKAIQELNDTLLMDRKIRVSLALERNERGGGGGGGGGRRERGEGRGEGGYRQQRDRGPRTADRPY